jgi:hypothetical protein
MQRTRKEIHDVLEYNCSSDTGVIGERPNRCRLDLQELLFEEYLKSPEMFSTTLRDKK